ncbi:PaaI family thioesterase [Mesobacillus maritimus]|uniref:PaaI family thioesterase n=1 Tax=Mesobacillus maritimus TaxID=1643336 RepID=UPI002041539C|nr:PaaI family thioesterase [Mesobacillus maritimus]MCM3586788.1 PaaI family thioesterase [Mesobacillus maritimus]MCM3668457.1 PaaI family thioesterase [Mesobacillus maritimus]
METNHTISSFYDYLGFMGEEREDSTYELELPINPFLLQDDGTVHPGVFATMLDIMMGATISRQTNSFATTIHLNLSYFDLEPQTKYTADTTILHRDGKYVTADGVVYDQDKNLIAKATGSFKLNPVKS